MVLEFKDLVCERGQRVLFSGLTSRLGAGSFLTVLGANGSGKSSLLKILAGLLVPDAGSIFWEGKKIQSPDPRFQKEIVYVGHKPALKLSLSPLENLRWWLGICKELIAEKKLQETLIALGLGKWMHRVCDELSAGVLKRVALARLCLMNAGMHARLWILDEPLNSLDDNAREKFLYFLRMHLQRGGMAVVASHEKLLIEGQMQGQEIVLG